MKTSDRFFLCWTNSQKLIPHKNQERNVSKTFFPSFLRRSGRRKKKRSPTLSLGKQKGENKRKKRRRRGRKGDFPSSVTCKRVFVSSLSKASLQVLEWFVLPLTEENESSFNKKPRPLRDKTCFVPNLTSVSEHTLCSCFFFLVHFLCDQVPFFFFLSGQVVFCEGKSVQNKYNEEIRSNKKFLFSRFGETIS